MSQRGKNCFLYAQCRRLEDDESLLHIDQKKVCVEILNNRKQPFGWIKLLL
jgi:hypothetical protein